MKRTHLLLLGLLLAVVGMGLTACVAEVDEGPHYYHHWYHDDDAWMWGPRGYIGVGVHPYYRRW